MTPTARTTLPQQILAALSTLPMSFARLCDACQQWPDLLNSPHDKITLYIALIRHLKPQIAFIHNPTSVTVPDALPRPIHDFLQLVLQMDEATALMYWTALHAIAWETQDPAPRDWDSLLPLFLEHGPKVSIEIHRFLPPVRRCINPVCTHSPSQRQTPPELGEHITLQAMLHTRAYGLLPISTTSTYCRGCHTRYHYNYFVQHNVRTYYDFSHADRPLAIQLSPHFFFELDLCERFAMQMAVAWTSAHNCARIYNAEAVGRPWSFVLPAQWPVTFNLDPELVLEVFIVHALLEWHHDHQISLQVPHKAPTQAERWQKAVALRNMSMVGMGQPAWNHTCNLCTRHLVDMHGNFVSAIRSVVTDGISLGHPCCGVHDCKQPLVNSKAHYCPTHADLQGKCAVEKCNEQADSTFRTCANPSHHAAEERFLEKGKVMFQLKLQLARASASSGRANGCVDEAAEGELDGSDGDEVTVDEQGDVVPPCTDKGPAGLRKSFARFGRRRTHNEELCVGSCGVILGRATFYGAEGANSVQLFWIFLFPTKACLPSIMWYDDNCHVSAMIEKDKDNYFDRVALPVDVFHFKSKHKESHGYCGRHCNPAMWPELIDEKTGRWVFNSSAAEQVNLWARGFHSITRLMHEDRFNFFLDEMIMRRNRQTIEALRIAGHPPYLIPRDDLLGGQAKI